MTRGVIAVVCEQICVLTRPQGGAILTHYHAWLQSYGHRPSHPYDDGTEHAGFSPIRQTSLARSAKLRDVLGESHEG